IAAALFTLALAGLSACQLEEMQRAYDPLKASAKAAQDAALASLKQAELMETDQRAWISFSGKLATSMTFDDTGPRVALHATIKNIGRLPAQGVYAIAAIFPWIGIRDPIKRRDAICDE